MKRSGVRIVTCALLAAFAGCQSDPPSEVSPSGFGDGGPSGRNVVDNDGGGDSGPSKAGDALDATMGMLPQGVMIAVRATNVADNAIVLSIANFKPTVEVKVVGESLEALNGVSIEDVYAEIEVPKPLAPQTPVKLGQVGQAKTVNLETTYVFGDVLVPVSALPSGEVQLKITVTTKSSTVTTRVPLKIDAGPSITFITPEPNQPFKNSARISVKIEDAVFSPVKDISISLGDTPQAFTMTEPGIYVSTIDFKSFAPRLSGRQLVTVRAKNSSGTAAVNSREFVADDLGPTFEMLTPAKGQMIGGIIEISAVVSDPAGVEPSSVVAVIGNGASEQYEVRLDPPALGVVPATYLKKFDTRILSANAIYPSLSFRASDKLGNESTDGYNLSLDNMPPLLDLDPPDDMRLLSLVSGGYKCSWPLDPVGPDAVDDGQYVNQAFDIRVRAEDQGNDVVSGSIDFVPIAGLKSVSLLALDDTARALVVDTDNDGMCDAVNPLLVPTSRPMGSDQILLLNMDPLSKAGGPDTFRESPPPPPNLCDTDPAGTKVEPLCEGPGPTYNRSKVRYGVDPFPGAQATFHSHFVNVFPTYTQDNLPSIWTLGPVRSGVECAGRQLESVGSNLTDGWSCFAAVGEDTLGRKQVSRPIRVCIDRDGDRKECPHQTIVDVTSGSPIEVTTAKDHGFATGDEVFIQGVVCQTSANGKRNITVTGPRKFTLNGVAGRTDILPSLPECIPAASGLVAATKAMPNCTGTQTVLEPKAEVDAKVPCKPWRSFVKDELRIFR